MDPVPVASRRVAIHVGKPIHFRRTALSCRSNTMLNTAITSPSPGRVTNWREYDTALKRRGSLTVWFTDGAIQAWQAERRTTPGGQSHYSSLAITTALTMRLVFGLALRQTEG
jgi:hypothetical protein